MKVIVLGGSGFIGSHVCEKLAALGHHITIPTRRLTGAKHLQMLPRLELLPCDVHDPLQLATAVAGHDVVINLVAVLHGNEARFNHVHVALVEKMVAACKAAVSVKRIVHISALGAALDAPSMYQRSKARGEQVLQASGLDHAILRPSVVFGAEDKFLNLFAKLQGLFPVMPLGGADAQLQPVWVEDVAQAIVELFHYKNNSCLRTIYEACGDKVYTLAELVQLAGRCSGQQRPIIKLPNWMASTQATMMEFAPGEPLMSRDNLASLLVPNIASGKLPGLRDLGITPASLASIAPTYLRHKDKLDEYRKHATRS